MTAKNPSQIKYDLVGFDLDGVIIDSIDAMRASWESVRSSKNVKATFEDYSRLIGMPFPVILSQLGITGERAIDVQDMYFAKTSENEDLIKPFSSMVELIRHLSVDARFSICIITSKPRRSARSILHELSLDEVVLLCPEDTGRGKPYPDPLLKANHIFGIRPDRSLYVGDMSSDLLSATRAGWDFALAKWGYGSNFDTADSHAYISLEEPLDLTSILLDSTP